MDNRVARLFVFFVVLELRFGEFIGMAAGSLVMAVIVFLFIAPVGIIVGSLLMGLGAILPSREVAASANVDPFV